MGRPLKAAPGIKARCSPSRPMARVIRSFTVSVPFMTARTVTAPSTYLLVSGNTLYGTAELGGAAGNGTAFSLSLAPVPTRPLTWPTIMPDRANLGWLDSARRYEQRRRHRRICLLPCNDIYSANFGWINLGNGSPTNGIYYQNIATNDFGVNQDGLGNLRGYAWGANLGWINFEYQRRSLKVDLRTGHYERLRTTAPTGAGSKLQQRLCLCADRHYPSRAGGWNANGLPVAWELQNSSGELAFTPMLTRPAKA